MKLVLKYVIYVLTTSFALTAPIVSALSHDHGAHVHGSAEMTIAIEKQKLLVNLEIPAYNLVGFEYKASNASETEKVKKAKRDLEKISNVIKFSGNRCKPTKKTIDTESLMPVSKSHEHHHHGHKEDHHHGHAEVHLSYEFHCKDAVKLTSVEITIFDKFPGIENVNAMWITESSQGAKELTAIRNIVTFKQ